MIYFYKNILQIIWKYQIFYISLLCNKNDRYGKFRKFNWSNG